MAQYQNMAELRADLTADDPDERAKAYGSVLQADLEVSEVLSQDPPVDKLVKAGIVPENKSKNRPEAGKHREETLNVLEEIRDLLSNDGGSE